MLVGFLAVASFLLLRYLTERRGVGRVKSVAIAAAGPLAILVASLVAGVIPVHGTVSVAKNGGAAAAPKPLHGEPVHARLAYLTAREVDRLVPAAGVSGIGYIDSINGINPDADSSKLHFRRGTTLTISGWASDASMRPAPGLIAVVDGKRRTEITRFYDKSRVDVARHFGERSMEFSGFEGAVVRTDGLANGRHSISLGIVRPDRSHFDRVAQVRWFDLQ